MSDKKCKYCAMLIPADAKICPYCRKKQGWSLTAKILAVLFITGLIARALVDQLGTNPPQTKSSTPEKPPQTVPAERLEIKGIPMEASEAIIKERFPAARCENVKDEPTDRMCTVDFETFADAQHAYFIFTLIEDRLNHALVGFKSSDFDHVVDALNAKYGAPSQAQSENVQNRMGAVFTNNIYQWKVSDVTITAQRYKSTLDYSRIIYSTDFYDQEYARRNAKVKEKAMKNL